jgi:hypothetical protein
MFGKYLYSKNRLRVFENRVLRKIFRLKRDEVGGARWRSWLRHYATNRNVAGSIPDGVNGINSLT